MALVFDPNSGVYIDPASGRVFHDAAGMQQVADPGLTQQAQRNLQISNQLIRNLAQQQQQFNQAQGTQQDFQGYLSRVISGSAPSVTGMQLQRGVGDIQRATQSQASGATGINQPMAQYAAIQATGAAGAQANQDAAIARQQELQQAQVMKAQVAANQAGQAGSMYGQNLQGAAAFSGQAQNPAIAQSQRDQRNKEMWMQFAGNLINAGGAALTHRGAA